MDLGGDESHEVVTGSMLFIEPDTQYQFVAGETGALLLGGPCPPDPSLYLHLGD
jgi:quercetin dioxygenase-like cupin family protein